jgi:hypothetical protein
MKGMCIWIANISKYTLRKNISLPETNFGKNILKSPTCCQSVGNSAVVGIAGAKSIFT